MKVFMLLTAAALLSGTALAQERQMPQSVPPATQRAPQPQAQTPSQSTDVAAIFDKLDVNHDGKLTPEEAQAHPTVAAHFKEADTNGDGVLSKEEFMAAFKPQ